MSEQEKKKKNLTEVIRHFTPSWYSVTMGTGILSVLLYVFPFQFKGLQAIAIGLYILNILLYTVFTLLTLTRYILFPSVFQLLLKHSAQSLFIGALPMGLTTITNFTILAIAPRFSWGLDLSFVLWCMGLALSVLSALVVPYFMIIHHQHLLETMNGTWLLPIVPCIVIASSGGLLAQHLEHNRAIVVLIISYGMMGAGLLLALAILGIYFCRLILHKLPSKQVIISSFLPLGPLGQGAYGMIQMGIASKTVFGDQYVQGLGTTAYGLGLISAFMLWGYGLWYLIIATLGITTKRDIPFNMGWWALTFPLGVFTAATLSIGTCLHMMFFHILGAILTGVLVIIWCLVMVKTLKGAFTRDMFYAPCLTPVIVNS